MKFIYRPSTPSVLVLALLLSSVSYGASVTPSRLEPLATPTVSTSAFSPWQQPSDELDLPNLQGQALSFADQYQNKLIGEWSLQNINGQDKMEHDPWIQETMKAMTWRLNAQARQQAPLALVIIDNPSINAFAAPGGVIGCLLYTSPSPRDGLLSRMPSSA